ncbi:hypothetical protein DRE_06714 [Drechslerella stenobrocha 248]|uniref:DUF8035 domain-containing protein n=1 Tax=Drechslerella stenobrocha 248 TaxID=1043628 RepID=W7HWV3_9PEZI|nr:hypothetical protein DRE_06714 [Drechslerella stenobrocha 248]
MTTRHEQYRVRRGDVDVDVDHRDRDYYAPGYHEHDHEYREVESYGGRGRDRERERGGEMTRYYERDQRSGSCGALVPVRQEKIIERDLYEVPPEPEPIIPIREIEIDPTIKVTEHEHEHVHHHNHIHIDHAAIHIVAEPPPKPCPPRREVMAERETLMSIRERRYGGKWNATGRLNLDHDHHLDHHMDQHMEHHHHHEENSRSRSQSRDREVRRTIGYGRYRERSVGDRHASPRNSSNALVPASPHGSGFFKDFKAEQEGWTVVDVPGAGRRITLEGGAEVSWNSSSFGASAGVRRSSKNPERTAKGELWTEVTKDLVCAEALEEFGYSYEETDNFVYVFDYIHRDQIQDLIELTKDIRRERVREIENSSRYERSHSRPRNGGGGGGGYYERDRFQEKRDYTPFGERDRVRDTRETVYY